MFWNKPLIELLLKMDREGYVTRKSQRIYISTLGYYRILKFLRDYGIIECNGVDENNLKIWVLTPKGKKLVEHIKAIRRLFGVENG